MYHVLILMIATATIVLCDEWSLSDCKTECRGGTSSCLRCCQETGYRSTPVIDVLGASCYNEACWCLSTHQDIAGTSITPKCIAYIFRDNILHPRTTLRPALPGGRTNRGSLEDHCTPTDIETLEGSTKLEKKRNRRDRPAWVDNVVSVVCLDAGGLVASGENVGNALRIMGKLVKVARVLRAASGYGLIAEGLCLTDSAICANWCGGYCPPC